jgi:hypothetical protein
MSAEQFTTIMSNLLSGGGVILFLWMWIRGLRKQLAIQKDTLEAVKTQVSETEKIGKIYRQLFDELPIESEKWKVTILKFKDERIAELEKAIQDKDERLKKTLEIEIEKLEIQQQALEDIPRLREELIEVVNTLQQRLSTVDQLAFSSPSLHAANKYRDSTELGKLADYLEDMATKQQHVLRTILDDVKAGRVDHD